MKGGVEGRKRSFNSVSKSKMSKMMEVTYQQCTEVKIKWTVKCYNEWHDMRSERVDCDLEIFEADLNDFPKLTKREL